MTELCRRPSSTRRPGWGKPIHQLLVDNRVTILFHGHDHFYAKQELDGVIYQLVPQPGHPAHGRTQAAEYGYKDGLFLPGSGYLKVNVAKSGVTVAYERTDLTGGRTVGKRSGGTPAYVYTVK